MSFNKILRVAGFGALAFVSCNVSKKTTKKKPVQMPEVTVSANNPLDIYGATPTKVWELVHTKIDIRFNVAQRTADAATSLDLHPYYYAVDSVILDAKGMKIIDVRDGNNQSLAYKYDTAQLKIRLPKSYQKEDTLHLMVKYTAMPYAFQSGGSKAITDDRGLYFINADKAEPYKPVEIWTQGETEANSHWFPTFDKSNFRSTFEITMHIPDSFQTLSNGTLVNSTKENNGLRADTWRQDLPIPPYLAMMAAGNFYIAKESWRGKEVSYYVPQGEYAPYAKEIFRYTPDMIEYFSQTLGVDFPWDKYSQVIVYDYVSGAMENVSASLFGSFNLKDTRQLADDNNDFITAHELFHQWFGDYVTTESWSNLTLNESFADFSERLWNEHKYGKEAGQSNWVQDLSKYLTQAKWNDPPLVRFNYTSQEDMFDRVTYSKGGLILNYLRQLMGEKAFFDALHLYLTQNALHSAEATQLRLAFEQVTGKDWTWFFNEWYYRGGHPKLEVSYAYDDAKQKATVNVTQVQDESVGLYQLPMKALIISGSNTREVDWDIEKKNEQFAYDYINGQRPVIVPDAGYWVPGEINDNKNAAQWKAQYLYSNDRISKQLAVKGLAVLKNNDTAEQTLLLALKDADPTVRALAVNAKDYEADKNISKDWINTIDNLAREDADSKVRYNALMALGQMKSETFISTYEQAISDSSYKVATGGLYALNQVNHKRAVDYVRNLHPETMHASVLLYYCGEVLSREGLTSDYGFFEHTTLRLFETNRLAFVPWVEDYLNNVKDETIYQKGVTFLQAIAQRDPTERYGFTIASSLFNLKTNAAKQAKIATDKVLQANWQNRKEVAAKAWDAYKKTVTDESLKTEIARMEKG